MKCMRNKNGSRNDGLTYDLVINVNSGYNLVNGVLKACDNLNVEREKSVSTY